jgi:hypothetical protein
MKTKTASSRLVLLGIAIAAALLTQPVRATAINTLVITENSSTSLTAVLNGTTSLGVTLNFSDDWTIGGLAGINNAETLWTEPGAPSTVVNLVQSASVNGGTIIVHSDQDFGLSGIPDGTKDTTTFTLNGVELDVTFHDNGDVAATPDTGMTASLFGLSLAGLAFFRRKLC